MTKIEKINHTEDKIIAIPEFFHAWLDTEAV